MDDQHSMTLSGRELMMLRAGLKAYLNVFDAHRPEDAGATHPKDQWIELQNEVGRLIWRLEEAGAGPKARVEHSPEAVNPDA